MSVLIVEYIGNNDSAGWFWQIFLGCTVTLGFLKNSSSYFDQLSKYTPGAPPKPDKTPIMRAADILQNPGKTVVLPFLPPYGTPIPIIQEGRLSILYKLVTTKITDFYIVNQSKWEGLSNPPFIRDFKSIPQQFFQQLQ